MSRRGQVRRARPTDGGRMIQFLDLKAQYKSIKQEVPIRRWLAVLEIVAVRAWPGSRGGSRRNSPRFGGAAPWHRGQHRHERAPISRFLAAGVGTGRRRSSPCRSTFVATVAAHPLHRARVRCSWISIPHSFTMESGRADRGDHARARRPSFPVHLYGQPADMDPIVAIARRHGPGRDRGRVPGARRRIQGARPGR